MAPPSSTSRDPRYSHFSAREAVGSSIFADTDEDGSPLQPTPGYDDQGYCIDTRPRDRRIDLEIEAGLVFESPLGLLRKADSPPPTYYEATGDAYGFGSDILPRHHWIGNDGTIYDEDDETLPLVQRIENTNISVEEEEALRQRLLERLRSPRLRDIVEWFYFLSLEEGLEEGSADLNDLYRPEMVEESMHTNGEGEEKEAAEEEEEEEADEVEYSPDGWPLF